MELARKPTIAEEIEFAKKQLDAEKTQELPQLVSFVELCKTQIQRPSPIIHGLFDQGSSMVVGGGSKTFKSWAMSDLALSIVAGVPWWGLGTARGAVIYCNFELKPYYCRARFQSICKAKGVPENENLLIWNLRGSCVRVHDFQERLLHDIEQHKATCVFVDPFYKLLGAKDERVSSELLPILEVFEALNVKTGASTICAAHFTKGNQAAKDPLDRISGGAALNRHPDCLITLTRHEEDEAFAVDIITRDYPPFDPFVVKWAHPLFQPEPALDPEKLKVPRAGRERVYCEEQIIEALQDHDDEFTTTGLQRHLQAETGMKETAFYELLFRLKTKKRIFRSKISKKWNINSGNFS